MITANPAQKFTHGWTTKVTSHVYGGVCTCGYLVTLLKVCVHRNGQLTQQSPRGVHGKGQLTQQINHAGFANCCKVVFVSPTKRAFIKLCVSLHVETPTTHPLLQTRK